MRKLWAEHSNEWKRGYQSGYRAGRTRRQTTTIRLSLDGDWEFRCASCAKKAKQCFWPLTDEFWNPKAGMANCRACLSEAKRLREKRRHKANDPKHIARCKAYREAYRETINRMRRLNYAEAKAAAQSAGRTAWKREQRSQQREEAA